MEKVQPSESRGLSPQHSSELNRGDGISAERYDELRGIYEGDNLAQMVIDAFDPESELRSLIRKHKVAAKAASKSGEWFREQDLFRQIAQFKKKRYGIDTKED